MSPNDSIGELLSRLSRTDILQHKELLKTLLEAGAQEKDSRINNELLRELIQDYHHNAERLRESEHLYRSVIAAMEEGIVIYNRNGKIVTYNRSAEQILGLTRDQLLGRTSTDPRWRAVHQDGSPYPVEEHPAIITLQSGEPQHGVILGVHKPDGGLAWISVNSQPVISAEDPHPTAVVATFVDVSNSLSREQELTRVSQTDHLTQIANRLKFNSAFERELRTFQRYGHVLSVLMFDIDHFKKVNDTHGHDIGDIVLVELVELVKTQIRESDLLARWGGEEFIILLPHTELSEAAFLGERIRAAIEKKRFPKVGHITCSFGLTSSVKNDTKENIIKRTDEALYKAKKEGRNRVVTS
ncbi:MAG: sensor domain-containing diguanylate cyclase [Spirochaetaceae bacterium]|nr:sensor domain-containing diguanylate cyclase [Spirochaetaceae bacterium]MCF7947421.1 sensor domain-containing diguanylate cyclase [Spirochaetia bacterium]MCF7951504.1 sensor domain-containing diguanylate cyclase [Spirochaetaceae bacterium]